MMRSRFVHLPVCFAIAALTALISLPANAQTSPNCGAITAPWSTPGGATDGDCDGFTDALEGNYLGTYPYVTCAATPAANDESTDAWPFDFNDDQLATITDVSTFTPRFGQDASPNNQRWDFNGDGKITILDVSKFSSVYTQPCRLPTGVPSSSRTLYVTNVQTCPVYATDLPCLRAYGRYQADDANADRLVILDFGRPYYQNNQYGTKLPGGGPFVNYAQIEEAVKDYLRGFWEEGGSNHIELVVGTNNCVDSADPSVCASQGSPYYNSSAGQLWALMISNLNNWVDSPPSYRSRMDVWAGSDTEPDWSSHTEANDLIDGYSLGSQQYRWIDFGSADGCPPFGSCNNGWSQADVYYQSWGNDVAFPFPDIYLSDARDSRQWYHISADVGLGPGGNYGILGFLGALTQEGACQTNGPCPGSDIPAASGWRHLWTITNSSVNTSGSPMGWSSDISWQQ